MQRYFIANEQLINNTITLHSDDAHHVKNVMRFRIGDNIICTNENEQTFKCEILELNSDMVKVRIIEELKEDRELPVKVTIAQGMPKGEKLELVLQKGTELGLTSYIPLKTKRTIVKFDDKKEKKKIERWEKILKEAAEQSYRSKIPTIESPMNLKELVSFSSEYTYKLVAYEETAKKSEEKSNLKYVLNNVNNGDSILAVFGPEGGLDEDEVSFLEKNGFITCALGPRILRTETAPLYLLSAVSYQLELLR
ncbi:MAG: rRNA ((1498)-N(3))-methyltransferase [Bacillales bacterium]|nr:rRNA ((1498)-N(3))-methyltransferase [Bacillales bacterium]